MYIYKYKYTHKWNKCFPRYMQCTLIVSILFNSLKCCMWPTDLFLWPTNGPWPAGWKPCSTGGFLSVSWLLTMVMICIPLNRSLLPSSWCWVQGRLSMPRVSPLEGSQFHQARQEVEAESLVLAAWALEQLCLWELSSVPKLTADSSAREGRFKQRQ